MGAQQGVAAKLTAWWQWPSVLSLEVPLIAVSWQRLLGSALGAPVHESESLLLGLTVWLIYSADRLLDGFGEHPGRTQRHHFYTAHRHSVQRVWLLVGLGSLGLALASLSGPEFLGGALLGAAMLGYFLCRHHWRSDHHPKELHIALLFALGVSLIPLLSGAALGPLVLFTLLFAALIFLNCSFVALWEGEHDLEPAPFAARHPRIARRLPKLALILALGCILLAALIPVYLPLELSLAGSSLLLYSLDGPYFATRLGPEARRVAGDAALLTPLLLLFVRG